jgi:hypothetical protein
MRPEKKLISAEYVPELTTRHFFSLSITGSLGSTILGFASEAGKAGSEVHVVKNTLFPVCGAGGKDC